MRRLGAIIPVVAAVSLLTPPAGAQEAGCRRAVIFTVPGVTWADIERWEPANILESADAGAVGSMSVRTIASRTTFAAGFATIGAGARLDGGTGTGIPLLESDDDTLESQVRIGGLDEIREIADAAGYSTVEPGALAGALGDEGLALAAIGNSDLGLDPPAPVGLGRWSLLAATDEGGIVDHALTGSELLVGDSSAPFGVRSDRGRMLDGLDDVMAAPGCASIVIDPGDLTRADALGILRTEPVPDARRKALLAADDLLGGVRERLGPEDLLMIVSPTSLSGDDDVHFGVAIAVGRFPPGTALRSASTRRTGLVTLPDVAPTVLDHLGIARPESMLGRFITSSDGMGDRIADAVALDSEAVFIDRMRTPISTGYVVFQVLIYGLTIWLLSSRTGDASLRVFRILEAVALGVVAVPVSTYLLGIVDQHALGPWWFTLALLVIDAALVALAWAVLRSPLDRLLGLSVVTVAVIFIDLIFGAPLQLNTVFSYSPIVAGRFAGLGNIAYSVLAATSLITSIVLVHRSRRGRRALAGAAVIFSLTVIFDGAPMLGSDIGGVIALVPGFVVAWFLLAGKRPTVRLVAGSVVATIVALGVFLAADLSRPEESRTHLAQLFESVRDGGFAFLSDAIDRKVTTNLRVFRSTIWTYLVPPALALMAWLLLRPRGRWRQMAQEYPRLRAGLIAGLILCVLGFAVNDSGIVVPATMLSFLAPMALLIHLSMAAREVA
jgi:hypothetical protein